MKQIGRFFSGRPGSIPEKSRRLGFRVLAYISLAIALLGVITPGLPTTEFVLLAAWAAAKGSPRLYQWMLEHRIFGPVLANWQAHRAISRQSKWLASLMMCLGIALMMVWSLHPVWIWTAALTMLLGSIWIWSRPEGPVKPAFERSDDPARD